MASRAPATAARTWWSAPSKGVSNGWKTDRIDLYWAHFADGMTPMEEILRAFDDLVRAGKIHYAGLSNFPAWRISRADLLAELARLGADSRHPNRVQPGATHGAIASFCRWPKRWGWRAALWSPLGGGFLTGKYRSSSEDGSTLRLAVLVHTEKTGAETAILDTVLAVAKEIGAAPTEIAIAWLLHKAAKSTTSLIPVSVPRTR